MTNKTIIVSILEGWSLLASMSFPDITNPDVKTVAKIATTTMPASKVSMVGEAGIGYNTWLVCRLC